MMKRIVVLVIFVIIANSFKCKNVESSRENDLFIDYLAELSVKVPDTTQYFVLVPKFGCNECVKRDLIRLSKYIEDHPRRSFLLITPSPGIIPEKIFGSIPVLVDSMDRMDQIDLGVYNLTIIKTDKGRIAKQYSFRVKDSANFCTILDTLFLSH